MYNPLLLPDLRVMLEEVDAQGLSEFCNVLHPAVAAEVLEGLSSDDIWKVLSYCPLPRQVEIFEFLSLAKQVAMVEDVDRTRLSRLLEEMSSDDRVALLNRMDPEHVERLMPMIAQAERANIRKLLSYPEHSAGSIMTTEYAWLPEEITVREALERLRRQAPDRETIYYVYILDEGRRLDGFLSLQDLILANPNARLPDIMKRDLISVRVDDDQELVAQELAKYDFLAIPVVDKQNQLVGIITYDDILDIVQEEATEDAYRAVAVQPLKDSYLDTPFHSLAWKRGVWLMFLAVVACGTAQVLHSFEEVSKEYVWLILFLPLVLASGGNAGSQSATLIIRALAVDDLTREQKFRLARREPLVGVALGLCLALVGFVAALVWFQKSFIEAGVVAMTVSMVVVVGTVIGALLPLVFRRFGMDPAIMSNPLISALGDVLGVIIYYSTAIAILSHTQS
ncbi:MAG: magnesium transporter [Planctomycetaceae bacterium]